MKTYLTILIMMIVFAFSANVAGAGISATKSFRMTVTIPAVAGLNIADQEPEKLKQAKLENRMETTFEEVFRGNKKVLLKSIVIK